MICLYNQGKTYVGNSKEWLEMNLMMFVVKLFWQRCMLFFLYGMMIILHSIVVHVKNLMRQTDFYSNFIHRRYLWSYLVGICSQICVNVNIFWVKVERAHQLTVFMYTVPSIFYRTQKESLTCLFLIFHYYWGGYP